MFSIDFPEIIIIFAVALVVLGPKKLPGAAAKVGRWVGRARSMARQFREQLEQEVASAENAADIRDSVDSVGQPPRPQPARQPAPEARTEAPPREARPEAAPAESVPREPVHHEPEPYSPMPPEGYGPQQLSFDSQLHDTALPAHGGSATATGSGTSPSAASHPEAHASDVRDWMPETQTWMASAGWEVPASAKPEKPDRAAPSAPASAEPAAGSSGASSASAAHPSERAK